MGKLFVNEIKIRADFSAKIVVSKINQSRTNNQENERVEEVRKHRSKAKGKEDEARSSGIPFQQDRLEDIVSAFIRARNFRTEN